MEKYLGNEPRNGTVVASNRGWLLFERGGDSSEWVRLKLVSKVARRHRANFSVAWSHSQQRLGVCHDSIALNEILPEMYDWVVEFMESGYGE